MTSPADLASLFGPPPIGPSQDLRFRQGRIVSWDPLTLSNVVNVGGTLMTDLPVLGVAETATFEVGDVVGLLVIGDKGAKTLAIIGQLVLPNSAQAATALSYLSSRVYADTVPDGEGTASATFTDLATAGPQVEVLVGPSGSIITFVAAQIEGDADDANWAAEATIEMNGANTLTTTDAAARLLCRLEWLETMAGTLAVSTNPAAIVRWDDLNPGLTTITMKYRRQAGAVNAEFFRRSLVVLAL